MFSFLAKSLAWGIALTLKPNKAALEAMARETSLSEIPPTPPDKK